MPPIWSYWEGPMPVWIQGCVLAMQRMYPTFTLITPDNIAKYLPNRPKQQLADVRLVAHRADYYRAALLYTYGGFWFDADTFPIKTPYHLATDHDLVYAVWDKEPRRVFNGYVYATAKSRVADQWFNLVSLTLAKKEFGWTALGESILTPLSQWKNTKQVPRSTFVPLDVDSNPELLFSRDEPEKYITEDTVCFGLNHSWMMFHYSKHLSRTKPCNCLFHQLLKRVS